MARAQLDRRGESLAKALTTSVGTRTGRVVRRPAPEGRARERAGTWRSVGQQARRAPRVAVVTEREAVARQLVEASARVTPTPSAGPAASAGLTPSAGPAASAGL